MASLKSLHPSSQPILPQNAGQQGNSEIQVNMFPRRWCENLPLRRGPGALFSIESELLVLCFWTCFICLVHHVYKSLKNCFCGVGFPWKLKVSDYLIS